jgi:DNA-binding NarL/FixJ family response regulator
MHKVLVADDLPAMRQHAAAILKETVPDIEVIEATGGAQALQLFTSEKPDMIMLDILMPEVTGIKVAQEIWAVSPTAKILFWSQFHRESYVREIAKIVPDEAIHGYALKTESDEKLRNAIRSVLLQDNPYIDPIVRGVQIALTTRDDSINEAELSILVDVVLGLTDKAIAWREHISVRGAQNRISALSAKLVKGLDDHVRETAGVEVFNTRARIILEAFRRHIVVPEDIAELERDLNGWLRRRFNYDAPDAASAVKPDARKQI